MAKRGIDKSIEKSTVAGDRTPQFKPRKITGSKFHGTAGSTASTEVDLTDLGYDAETTETELNDLQSKFDSTFALLDKKGESMNLCQSLPETIRLRYARQKKDGESCWAFYKRMVAIAMESPDIDATNMATNSEAISDAGNDIVTDPFGNDDFGVASSYDNDDIADTNIDCPTRDNGYNENPGKKTLLLMGFLAVLKLSMSSILAVMKYPMKVFKLSADTNTDAGIKTSTETAAKTPQGGGAGALLLGVIKNLLSTAIFSIAIKAATKWVEQKISGGPKMSRDVERFDSLIISGFVKETSYQSEASDWPEAAMLYTQVYALQKEYNASQQIFTYYRSSGLSSTSTSGSSLNMSSDILSIVNIQKTHYSNSLDQITAVLNSNIGDSLFCCLVRYLGSYSDKFLRICQAILRIGMNRQAIKFEGLDASLSNIWQTIQKTLLSQMISILTNLFNEINKEVKGSMNLALQTPAYANKTCPSWNTFLDSMLEYIKDIEKSILDLAIDMNNSIRLKENYQTLYFAGLTKNKKAKSLLSLINAIIKARANGEICRTTTVPTDSELSLLYNQIRSGDDTTTTTTTDTTTIVSTTGTTETVVSSTNQTNFNDCLKKVPAEDVEKVMAWINALKG